MTVTVLLAAVLTATAQQDASFSHYWAMETSFNPAAAGKQSMVNVTGAYSMSMVGFEHNPKTMYVSGDMPLLLMNTYHGVGLMLMSDDIGIFSHQRLAAQYAFKLRLFGGTLSVGVQAGMLSEKYKGRVIFYKVDTERVYDERRQRQCPRPGWRTLLPAWAVVCRCVGAARHGTLHRIGRPQHPGHQQNVLFDGRIQYSAT